MVLLVCLGAAGVSAQLTYYIDERGRRVYVNADPKPQAADKPQKARPSPRYSVLMEKKPVSPAASSAVPAPSAAPVQVDSLIQEAAHRHEVDANLVRAVIRVESSFNARAVSNKGAMGLMQLVPATARRFGVENAFNPVENVEGGVRYLRYLLDLYGGNLNLSLAAYNAGEKAVERHGGVPPYRETRDYVKKIGDHYGALLAQRLQRKSFGIVKYVDENGRVLFTNAP